VTVYHDMASSFEQHAADSAYNAHYARPAVLDLVDAIAGLRVLDAGCGPGFYAEELPARGVDPWPSVLPVRWSSSPAARPARTHPPS
jgi:2-polyprenyl-3-methyl-5-hydroxy-6-metoxy-1,4-benzoquinol methylase